MKNLLISLANFAVKPIDCELDQLPGITHNGQHYQLAGFAIVNIGMLDMEMLHPTTGASNGHFDVKMRYRAEGGVSFHRYSQGVKFSLGDNATLSELWPTGVMSLLNVAVAAEVWFAEQIRGFQPVLRNTLRDSVE